MDLADRLKALATRIPQLLENIQTEEATKNALIIAMKKLFIVVLLSSSLTASAQSIHQIVLNITNSVPFKAYSPIKHGQMPKDKMGFIYSLARLGSFVAVSFSISDKSSWYLSIENPKTTASEVAGTKDLAIVKTAPIRISYRVNGGKLKGACLTTFFESVGSKKISMIGVESKTLSNDWGYSTNCK